MEEGSGGWTGRGEKQRSSERECDLSRGSLFTAKTLRLCVLLREVTDIQRYVNITGSVHWSDQTHTLSVHKWTHTKAHTHTHTGFCGILNVPPCFSSS